MKYFFYIIQLIGISFIVSCSVSVPSDYKVIISDVNIYPDYSNIVLPFNIAPLNFLVKEDFDDCIEAIENSINELKSEVEALEEYKTDLFINMEKFSDEHGLLDYDITEDDDFRVGGTE